MGFLVIYYERYGTQSYLWSGLSGFIAWLGDQAKFDDDKPFYRDCYRLCKSISTVQGK